MRNVRNLHNTTAEFTVVGILINEPNRLDECKGLVPEDFYDNDCGAAFGEIRRCVDEGVEFNIIDVCERSNANLERLIWAIRNIPSFRYIEGYAERIKQHARERALFTKVQGIQDVLLDYDNGDEALDQAEALVTELTTTEVSESQELVSMLDCVKGYVERLDWRFNNPGVHGITTGYQELDARYQGWKPGDLIIVAGRPGMGKTTFATNLVEHVAIERNEHTLVFSLEMPRDQLTQRMMASIGHIPLAKLKDASALADDENPQKIQIAAHKLAKAPLAIDDTPSLDVAQLRDRARRRHRASPIKFILVDYLQLMEDRTERERFQVISAVSRKLKALAKELGCVVVALSQLNRDLEKRPNKRPINSDLRESGQIEQDADMIIMLYRDEAYDEDTPHKGILEVITTKFRDGEPGTDYLAWIGAQNRIANLEFRPQEATPQMHKPFARGFE